MTLRGELLQFVAAVGLGNSVGPELLHGIERMSERFDIVRIDLLHFVDQTQNVANAFGHFFGFGVGDMQAGEVGDLLDLGLS